MPGLRMALLLRPLLDNRRASGMPWRRAIAHSDSPARTVCRPVFPLSVRAATGLDAVLLPACADWVTAATAWALLLDGAGISFDRKRFVSHVTLGRRCLWPRAYAYEERLRPLLPISTTVDHLSLMKSERLSGKLVYTELS